MKTVFALIFVGCLVLVILFLTMLTFLNLEKVARNCAHKAATIEQVDRL